MGELLETFFWLTIYNGSYFGISHIQIVLAKAGYYSIPMPRPKDHGNYLLNFIHVLKAEIILLFIINYFKRRKVWFMNTFSF